MSKLHDNLTPDTAIHVSAQLTTDAPFRWLRRGWTDLMETGFAAVFYGAVFTLMGFLITWMYGTRWQLTMGMISGFFLMGPFICAGIYDLSRQLKSGVPVSLWHSLVCWRNNAASIALFAVMLTFIMVVWARVSVIIFALTSTHHFATLGDVLSSLFSADNLQFVVLWSAIGFVFASLVFAIGLISVPLMLDREADTPLAVYSSARALYLNPKPLYLWAALIVVIIGASLLLSFWPLLITAPLVGHATWHAYQDLVESE